MRRTRIGTPEGNNGPVCVEYANGSAIRSGNACTAFRWRSIEPRSGPKGVSARSVVDRLGSGRSTWTTTTSPARYVTCSVQPATSASADFGTILSYYGKRRTTSNAIEPLRARVASGRAATRGPQERDDDEPVSRW